MQNEASIGAQLKVIHAIFGSPWDKLAGGGQLTVHRLASAMASQGHNVHVLYSTREDGPSEQVGYTLHITRPRYLRLVPGDFIRQGQYLAQMLDREHFDAVIGYGENAFSFASIARRRCVPFHMVFLSSHLPHSTSPFRWKDLEYWLLRRTLLSADEIHAVSLYSKSILTAAFGAQWTKNIRVNCLGVDPIWATVAPLTTEQGKTFRLVTWSRLEPGKGIEILLEVVSVLRKANIPAEIAIIGEGSLRWRLARMAMHIGVSSSVIFHGALPPEEIVTKLSRSHVAVFATERESFGLSIAEAVVSGMPVVAPSIGAIPEIAGAAPNVALYEHGQGNQPLIGLLSDLWHRGPWPLCVSPEPKRREFDRFSWYATADRLARSLVEPGATTHLK